ncbi:MAG: NAD(P)H-hydrate dehydratase [Bacteroidota bacterium]
MKIFSTEQIRAWDAYTIEHEPISSLDLMERASAACVEWIRSGGFEKRKFHIFCVKGNTGGDGLAIARMLLQYKYDVEVYILEQGAVGTPDFQVNLQRLHKCTQSIHFLQTEIAFPKLTEGDVVIDALFGIGLFRPVEGLAAALINHINISAVFVISIDLPSGMYADISAKGNDMIKAHHTLSFQCWKLALLMEENAPFLGVVHILPIGLDPAYERDTLVNAQMITGDLLTPLLLKRSPFSYKGDYGHALIIAGSKGKIGAAVLAARSSMRSGAGLLTVHVPECGYQILQIAIPEAMVSVDQHPDIFSVLPQNLSNYSAIGVGPGLGMQDPTSDVLLSLLKIIKQPMVLDADALNVIAQKGTKHCAIPPQSMLTPHPGEFERLFGKTSNHFERMKLALQKAADLNCIIIIKSKFTLVALPNGNAWFNPTGNPGMAKAGSGDVLTGILTGLLARGYQPELAALLGVYLHGYAGDLAVSQLGFESALADDITSNLPFAFSALVK